MTLASPPDATEPPPPAPDDPRVRTHLAFGWWSLAVFTALGLLLETAHGLKLGFAADRILA